ncbi:putative ribonuclease h protein [Quercus suber]|uniref:Ribonuclease h protein n=1 Tax=Quercus suber TaxID=58331 RepID=A0AAW0M9L2_QUESU
MEWKTELIRSCFTVEDADAILSIPLSLHRPKDRRVWAETPNGKFSVKSAYRLAYEENRGGGKVGCSDPSARKKAWRGLWGLNLPQKVKHFAWKAARNILASNEALRQRHIEVDGGCALCRNPTENILHILWFCAHAKHVWNSSKFYLPFDIGPTWSFLDVLENLQRFEDVQPGLTERFISVCWGIWKERNIIRTGGSSKPGRVTLKNSLGLMNEYQLANEGSRNPAAGPPEQIGWKPPSQGQYKVNTDGAVFANQRKVGLGVLIRDCSGAVIAALSSPMVGLLGALETETKALEIGMRFALDVGIRDAVFESDALEVVNAVQGITLSSSSTQFLVDGIHQQACLFRSCCFTHTKRQGNVPAHMLAQYSKSLDSYAAWLESCPSHIMQACAQDFDVTSTV